MIPLRQRDNETQLSAAPDDSGTVSGHLPRWTMKSLNQFGQIDFELRSELSVSINGSMASCDELFENAADGGLSNFQFLLSIESLSDDA